MYDTSPLLGNVIEINDIKCRICKENMTQNEYKKYCDCSGDIKYTHKESLNTWLNISRRISCEFCNTEYLRGNKMSWMKFLFNINYCNVVTILTIFSILVFSLIPNDVIYSSTGLEKLCVVFFIMYIIKRSFEYIEQIYNESHIINVLEIE